MNTEPRPTLLIIEDDVGLQRQLRWAYDDYEVIVAGDRREAIDAVRAEEPAVVTLDLGLPPDADGVSEGLHVPSAIVAAVHPCASSAAGSTVSTRGPS